MIAKGARRPRSALRGLLQPFQLLDLRWSGKSELRTLMAAEWVGGLAMLSGSAIMPGFYLNELMVRLLPREIRILWSLMMCWPRLGFWHDKKPKAVAVR
jgi:DNA repair protein RecO (recombination protein O)